VKVLLTGAAGQLGQALMASIPEVVQLIACTRTEPELAQDVNAGAPAAFAGALAVAGGRLLQVSTDFVFNGSQGSPNYLPEQALDL